MKHFTFTNRVQNNNEKAYSLINIENPLNYTLLG